MDWRGYARDFSPEEFRCLCGDCQHDVFPAMDEGFVRRLQAARILAGIPFVISAGGGLRSPEFNAQVGGSPSSSHLRGKAADILTPSADSRRKILKALIAVGFDRIGVYDKHIHVDNDKALPPDVYWWGQSSTGNT